jgi:hypothetical protein
VNQRLFALACLAHGLPAPEFEHQFAKPRRWRFDACWPAQMVALEVEGGAWVGGRHNRGGGYLQDMVKYNRAVILGWRLLRCTPQQVNSGEVFALLAEAMGAQAPAD